MAPIFQNYMVTNMNDYNGYSYCYITMDYGLNLNTFLFERLLSKPNRLGAATTQIVYNYNFKVMR